jgi:uroporphyrinogen-III synthase
LADHTTRPTGLRRLDRLIVTRPAPDAAAWVNDLREQGWPAQALPLIDIAAPETDSDLQTLRHWRAHWAEADAILFVSGAAVNHFFAEGVARPVLTTRSRFWAPGPGTARLLAQAIEPLGLSPDRIDAPAADADQFDSEHLWPVVSSQLGPGCRVLIVRGSSRGAADEPAAAAVAGNGRDWLIRQCRAAGAQVEGCVAYARRAPVLSAADRDLIHAAMADGSVWLFSSSEALTPLQALHPAPAWASASALVTHPRIAATAQQAGFGHVMQTRPALTDVVRALESGWTRP